MAIQTRRGNESDFDPNRMVPGEWATATDTEKVWMCFKTGKVRRMATYEDMVENIGEATEEIKTEFTAGVKSATEAAAGAANTANKAAETASNASNTANAAAETAMNAAEKAEAAAGGDISEKTVSFEEVETYSKPTSGSKISSIIANLVMGISQLFSDLANKIDSSKVLSAEEWGAAISERGYLADAKDVKDSLTQLNTNIATTKDSAIKVKATYKAYSAPAGKTVYITPKDADFSGGTVLCAIPELVAASAGWDNTIISVGTSDDGKNIRLYSSVSQNLYVRVIFLYT